MYHFQRLFDIFKEYGLNMVDFGDGFAEFVGDISNFDGTKFNVEGSFLVFDESDKETVSVAYSVNAQNKESAEEYDGMIGTLTADKDDEEGLKDIAARILCVDFIDI